MPQQKKRVYKFDFNGNLLAEYPSITIAAKDNNTEPNKISSNCNGRIKSSLGFIYSFNDKIEVDKSRKIKNTANTVTCPHCEKQVKIRIIKGEYLLVKK